MTTAAYFLICLLTFAHLAAAAADNAAPPQPEIGDSEAAVIEALGEPAGNILLREKTLLLYPRGEITLRDGRVTAVDLMDTEAFAAHQADLRKEREEWLAKQEAAEAARIEEGRQIKAGKRSSSQFVKLPAEDRIAFWRRFQKNYPEVDVSEELAQALESREAEIAELETRQTIAELKSRVAEAERSAEAARLETEKLRKETEFEKSRGLRYHTTPVIHDRHFYRPPTVIIHTQGGSGK